jgi:hypothetical protein
LKLIKSYSQYLSDSLKESLDLYSNSSLKFKIGETVKVKGRLGKITGFNGKNYFVLIGGKNEVFPEKLIEKPIFKKGKLVVENINQLDGDYGYHAGNLAHKSGTLSRNNFMPTLRSQLGTGYYFFGQLSDAEELAGIKGSDQVRAKELKGTAIYQVDFSKYNLFRPGDRAVEYYHNLVLPLVKILNSLSSSDINDPEIIEGLSDIADYYRDFGIEISDSDLIKIVDEYLQDIETFSSDSDELINTRIMKHAGYEGIDLRNTEKDIMHEGRAGVGSVIFDLKRSTIKKIY